MNSKLLKYRRYYIEVQKFIHEDDVSEWIAGIYNNGVCYKIVCSYISEEKAIDKAKAYIDELLEEIE